MAVRAVLVLAATGGAGAGTVQLALPALRDLVPRLHRSGLATVSLDQLLTGIFAAVLLGCVTWLALVVVATLTEALTGHGSRAVRAVSPAFVRRGVAVACGVALTGSALAGPATATTGGAPGPEAGTPDAVRGLVLPDRAPVSLPGSASPRVLRPQATALPAPEALVEAMVEAPTRPGFGGGPSEDDPSPFETSTAQDQPPTPTANPAHDPAADLVPETAEAAPTTQPAAPPARSVAASPAPVPAPSAAPAPAAPGSAPAEPRAAAPAPARPLATAEHRVARAGDVTRRLVVQPGDSLWSIAAALLPSGASAQEVDRTWRALYLANRTRVGEDPDLVLPGTTLTVPQPTSDRKDAP